jgi:hypothetical protein
MISIFVRTVDQAGKFEARLDGRLLCVSVTPFLDAARVLVARGHDPGETLAMFSPGQDRPRMTGRLGEAAKLAIHEGPNGPRCVRWVPTVAETAIKRPVDVVDRFAGRSSDDAWTGLAANRPQAARFMGVRH